MLTRVNGDGQVKSFGLVHMLSSHFNSPLIIQYKSYGQYLFL